MKKFSCRYFCVITFVISGQYLIALSVLAAFTNKPLSSLFDLIILLGIMTIMYRNYKALIRFEVFQFFQNHLQLENKVTKPLKKVQFFFCSRTL